jgi:hypothetical protein
LISSVDSGSWRTGGNIWEEKKPGFGLSGVSTSVDTLDTQTLLLCRAFNYEMIDSSSTSVLST